MRIISIYIASILTLVLLIFVLVPVGQNIWSQLVPAVPAITPPDFDIGEMFRDFKRPWSTSQGFILAGIVFILALFFPKEPLKWARPFLFFLAVLITLVTFAFSEYAMRLSYEIEKNEDCVAHKDCGPKADDIPVVRGGTVTVPRGKSVTVHVIGEGLFEGSIDYCLNFADPTSVEDEVEWIVGTRLFKFTPLGGERTVTVTSLPDHKCD